MRTGESLVNKVKPGDKVVFHIGDNRDFRDWGFTSELEMDALYDHDGQVATVDVIAVDDGDPASQIIDGPFYVDITFDDGFEMQAVDGYNLTPVENTSKGSEQPVRHDFIPAVGPESVDHQAEKLVKSVVERARKRVRENRYAAFQRSLQQTGDVPPTTPPEGTDEVFGHDPDATAVQSVLNEIYQFNAGQMEELIGALADAYTEGEMLTNMDAKAIEQHLRAAAQLLSQRTGN